MAVNTQFSIAVHIMAGLGYKCGSEITSSHIAASVNTSPSFVRRILARLSKAGLVRTATGKNGACRLARDAEKISLLEIYQAVDAPKVFAIHQYAELGPCPVSCHIKSSLERVLGKAQKSVEETLRKVSLAEVIADMRRCG
jgi:Rrf2 family protein